MKLHKKFLAASLAALLVGCGGSDSTEAQNTQNTQNTQTQTAQFIDGYIKGLQYVNGSRTGYTNANGEFSYTDGNISFYLGDMLLGTIEAANVPSDNKLFVQDLVGVDRNETSNADVLKMATLLQTLDADKSTDTIEINTTVRAAFDVNTTLANFPDANITDAYTSLGITRVMKPVEVQAHLEDMRKKHEEVSDTTAPSVVSNASYTNVDLDNKLCIDFSERIPKDMITSSNFTVNPTIAGTLDRDNTEVCFTPDANLTAGQTYTITADGGIADYAGNALGADASVSYEVPAAVIPNESAVWSLANGLTQTAIEGSGAYIIDLTGSTDADSDTLSYEWFIVPSGTTTPVYNQSSGNISINTTTTIDFATADARTNTPVPLPAGDYRLQINQYEDRGTGSPVVTQQTVTITIAAAANTVSDDLILKIQTDANGSTNPSSFTVYSFTGSPSYNVDCDNDGTNEATDQTGFYTCSYANDGEYEVRISGTYYNISFSYGINIQDQKKVIEVLNWGTAQWQYMTAMFSGASNLTGFAENAGKPDLANVSSLNGMFTAAVLFNADIGDWNTSSITDMRNTFDRAESFNADIGSWDTSNVTNMGQMFEKAYAFNQDISGWDVSKVTTMQLMFTLATSFNQDISSWDVSSVQNMYGMFRYASAFQQDINAWNIGNVTSMDRMFEYATAFNQDLTTLATKKNASLNTGAMFDNSGMSQANIDTFIPPVTAVPLDARITPSTGLYCFPNRSGTGDTVSLSGSASTGNIASWSWLDVTGNNDITTDSTQSDTSFFCGGFPAGNRTIRLTVTDNTGATDTYERTIQVIYN